MTSPQEGKTGHSVPGVGQEFWSQRKVEIASHVRAARVEGDYVLMDLRRGVYLGLDPVASRIWESLADHGKIGQAAQDLCREYAVELERALADIEEWVAELVDKGLVTVREAGT